ncbi:MAG TPA: hypothetical protein VKB15_09095 [Xanthobacteraceae bacterium]|nr:hypothetical protein [Xanthobacteraceae bacterium]
MRYRIGALVAFGLISLAGQPTEVIAAPQNASAQTHAAPSSDLSSQRRRMRRSPVRITVYPRSVVRSGLRIDVFPRPYPYEWPGPNAKRDCIGWLAAEARPSGTVIVPRRRCWWVLG